MARLFIGGPARCGGVKAGSIGRELGVEEPTAYQTLKSIYQVGPAN